MKKFLIYTLATITGIILSSVLLLFIILGIAGAIASSSDKPVTVKANTILKLTLDKPIVERSQNNFFEDLNITSLKSEQKTGLNDILNNIQKAKTDDNIKGIYLELFNIPASIASVEEIRNALIDFKKSGKFIIAYADMFLQKSYYLASVADKVYMNPEGTFLFYGSSSEVMFFKGTFEKLGLEPQVIRHGKFKGAVEPFMYDKLSDENRLQISKYISSIWGHTLTGISEQRKISVTELNAIANRMVIGDPDSCISLKLVDSLLYKDQINDILIKLAGQNEKEPEFINLSKYNKVPKKSTGKGLAKNKIAVIYAFGDVQMGNDGDGTVSAERIAKALYDARTDSSIKAIVFRINSPGGDALAADIIWREVELAEKTKPVVASMGDLAASGGYYIACPADTIVASPNTITGSIGVFGLMITGKEFLNKKLGITTDVVKTNEHSDLGSFSRPLDKTELAIVQLRIEKVYNTFITHVANGRGLTKEKVDEIAQGRVWTGIDAKELGLVDVMGGLNDAIRIAAQMAKLDSTDYRVVDLPKLEEPFEKLVKELTGDVKTSILKSELGDEYKYYMLYKQALKMEGIQARIPYNFDIQ
jgi:protease-4